MKCNFSRRLCQNSLHIIFRVWFINDIVLKHQYPVLYLSKKLNAYKISKQNYIYFFQKLEENVNASNIKDVTPTECLNLAGNFTKKHIVIFDEFDGECFEAIKNTQALYVGIHLSIFLTLFIILKENH